MVGQEPGHRVSGGAPGGASRADVRQTGFSDRASLEKAIGWIDARAAVLPLEAIRTEDAAGRVLAAPIDAATDFPPLDRAGEDGFALRSAETIGAGSYSPILLELQPAGAPLRAGAATLVAAGTPLPCGADAVLPFGMAHLDAGTVEIVGAVAEGMGVERLGQHLRAGTALFGAGHALRPQDAALLATLGVGSIQVVRRPRVRLVLAGPKGPAGSGFQGDAHRPMLLPLIARDGGVVEAVVTASERASTGRAIAAPGADLVLVTGRTGTGPDDEAPLAIADVGELAIHGIALRPGASAGLGAVATVSVLLLPGDPLACLCAYELLAGRLLRRLGGRDPELPHRVREAEVGRKIVSGIGFSEMCEVRLVDGRVEPVGRAEGGGLTSAIRSDGFVLVPAALEGYAPGARVDVHLYESAMVR